MSCGRRGRAAPGAADARLRSGGEKPSPRRSRRCRPRRLPAQADHPTRAGPGSHDTQRPAATRLCLRLRGASAVLACGVRRKGRAEREEWAEGAARRGAGRRGLGRVSVGPRARGGRESGRLRPPPGVSPAVGGAPWRLAGGSRGGCG